MGNLVSDGEGFGCPFCTGKIKLGVSSSPMTGDGKKIANTDNYSLSAPGAQCIVVPSAPAPCQPSVQNIDPGQSPVKIEGSPALGAGCKFMCAKGGLLTVSSSAQSSAHHDGAAAAISAAAAAGYEVVPSHLWEAREEDKKSTDENKSTTGNNSSAADPASAQQKNKKPEEKKDKTSAKERNKESKRRDGAPKNNQAQNKQFKGAVKEIEKKINKKLTNDDLEVLHDEITGKNLSYHDIVEVGVGLFE